VSKQKNILVAGSAAIAIAAVAYWMLVQQPARQAEMARVEQALLASGIQLYNEKQFEKALQVFERIRGDSDRAARARYYQGNAFIQLRDYESAASRLERSLALDDRDADTRFALGVVYYKLGNLPLARAYFASVLEIEPETDEDRERREEAAGLMDIVARLERQQSAADGDAQPADDGGDAAPSDSGGAEPETGD
jgi:tetratricopeptide (TPR) repeat protein